MNAITLLKKDHETVDALFDEFEKAKGKSRKRIVEKIIEELSIHAAIEEQIVYPFIRKNMKDEEDKVLESLEEHHVVKWLLSELDGMSANAERFEAKVMVLIENVRHHVEEEEEELFPKVQKKIDAKLLNELGMQLERAKKMAPTRPHPRAPDTPPGNLVAGMGAGALDRARDAAGRLLKSVANRRASAKKGARKTGRAKTARARSASAR